MSVINKMLRDLDQRAPLGASADSLPAGSGIRQGTATVGAGSVLRQQAAGRRMRYGLVATVVAAVGVVAAMGWWQMQGKSNNTTPLAQQPVAPKLASAASVPLPVPVAPSTQASAPAADPVSAAAAVPGSAPAPAEHPMPPGKAETALLPGRAYAPPPAKASAGAPPMPNIALRMETALELRSLKEPASAARAGSASAIAAAPATPTAPVQANDRARPQSANAATVNPIGNAASAAQDALAQAQTLWNAGSKDAAVELLRDAVAIADRSGPSGTNVTLIPLVRELTRMQLAEGHFGAVWDLLNRLEPHLGNQADLWAIRANAAQRLGRHQDSVHAYMVALQSRPSEQRWLLGSAVSLAALGQTSSAAEMADKARAAGPISKDVQAYLRQMNVPVRD